MMAVPITPSRSVVPAELVQAAVSPQHGARAATASLMSPVLVSSARDRWLSTSVREYTPERVEQIIRGAMSGDLTAQWALFDVMEGSWPRLAKNLAELKEVLEDHDWSLVPWSQQGQPPTPGASAKKDLVEHVLWHMTPDPTRQENDFSDLTFDLADAWSKGVSVQEIDWVPMSMGGRQILGVRCTRWVHPRNYGWPAEQDQDDRLMLNLREILVDHPSAAEVLEDTKGQWAPFPADKFLIAIARHRTGHPLGTALLRPLAWWWAISNFTAEWLVQLAQIFGVPIRWANYAAGTPREQIRKIEEMLDQMGSNPWGAFPAGTTLELKAAMTSGTDNPQTALLSITDKIADLVVLGQTLTSEAGDRGSQALGTVHQDVLHGRKRALLKWVVKTLNQHFIPAILRVNFGDTQEAPYFIAGKEDVPDTQALAQTYKVVLESGVPIPGQWYYDRLGIPKPDPDDDDIIKPLRNPSGGGMPGPFGGATPAPEMTQAKAAGTAQEQLAETIAESITGVQARWLGGAVPWFIRLIKAAEDPEMSEQEFGRLLDRTARQLPSELAPLLDTDSLAKAMEAHMGAAVVNGALAGWDAKEVRR